MTQTIANGSTVPNLVNWRAVYDANGDKVEDDPGTIAVPRRRQPGAVRDQPAVRRHLRRRDRSPSATASTPSRCAHSTTAAPCSPPTPSPPPSPPRHHHHRRRRPVTRPLRRSRATSGSRRPSPTSVAIAWNAATDNVGVTGYDLYRGSSQVGTTTADHRELQRPDVRNRVSGRASTRFDAAGNASPPANMTVTTSACADTQPPTAPTNVTVSTRTTTSIALTWAPATDNVGVAGYGIYNGADLVDTTAGTTGIVSGLTCGTNYTLAVDAFDATGNSSPKTTIMVSTLPCTDTTPPVTADQPAGHLDNDAPASRSPGTRPPTTSASPATTSSAPAPRSAPPPQPATRSTGSPAEPPTRRRQSLDTAGNTSTQATTSVTTSAVRRAHAPTRATRTRRTPASRRDDAHRVHRPVHDHDAEHGDRREDDGLHSDINATGVVIRNSRISCGACGRSVDDRVPRRRRVDRGHRDRTARTAPAAMSERPTSPSPQVDIISCENGLDVDQQHRRSRTRYIHDLYNGGAPYGRCAVHWTLERQSLRLLRAEHHDPSQHDLRRWATVTATFGTSAIITTRRRRHERPDRQQPAWPAARYTLYCEHGLRRASTTG